MSNEVKDSIQYKKASEKIDILKNLIYSLIDYNNISDYYNQKDFAINIDYRLINNYYVYKIILIRGNINPKIILESNIKYKDKLDTFIIKLLEDLINNKDFHYTSYNELNNYVINMKNNIKIIFPNHDLLDKKMYENIENNFKNKVIKEYYNNNLVDYDTKNKVQNNKLLKNIDIIMNVFEKLSNLNKIQDYENNKPYKLKIRCDKDIKNNCYKYYFNIIRGNNNPTNLLELTSSIEDNNIIYEEFNKIINKYLNSDYYLYTCSKIEDDKEIYNIYLNNLLNIEFETKNEYDKLFFKKALNIEKGKTKELIK